MIYGNDFELGTLSAQFADHLEPILFRHENIGHNQVSRLL
jgi:hypothetical protein